MTKEYNNGLGRGKGAREDDRSLDRLRRDIEAAAAESGPSPEQAAGLDEWAAQLARSGAVRNVQLSTRDFDLLAYMMPPESVTDEWRSRLDRTRVVHRTRMLLLQTLERECHAASPSELFRELRERAELTTERSADLFGVSHATWIAVEAKQSPWYRLPARAVPAFAASVREPTERLIALIAVTARRAVLEGVKRRTGRALGRFDNAQDEAQARRDTLRAAFARVNDENQGAAAFLQLAWRTVAATEKRGPRGDTR
jgi:transcriptional regulator with XRE-family HTH domain